MSPAFPIPLETLLKSARVSRGVFERDPNVVSTAWRELDRALPDGGFPRGVVEIASPFSHGGGTTLAMSAMHAAHVRDTRAWCAWVEPVEGALLHAPFVVEAGVDLARLLVVRAPKKDAVRALVRVVESGAFDVVASPIIHARMDERVVRKLALAAEERGGTTMLLTDAYATHGPWPVALRLEVERIAEAIRVRVAKDKRGRAGMVSVVPLHTRRSERAA